MGNDIRIDTKDFQINQEKCPQAFFAFATDPNDFSPKDLVKEWHIEHIRRFNVSANYLYASLTRFMLSASMRIDIEDKDYNEQELQIINQEFRLDSRDLCINIAMYVDKVKSFCGHYFFINPDTTQNAKEWIKTMEHFIHMPNGKWVDIFLSLARDFYNMESFKFVKNIRDDEIHNESVIELMDYDLVNKDGATQIVSLGYIVSENSLYGNILDTIEPLKELSKALNNMILRINPVHVYKYLEDKKWNLKGIINPDERYKKAREIDYLYSNVNKE